MRAFLSCLLALSLVGLAACQTGQGTQGQLQSGHKAITTPGKTYSSDPRP